MDRRHDQAAKSAEMRLRAALDAQLDPEAILTSRRDDAGALVDLVFTEVNPAAQTRLGRSSDELVGRGLIEVFGERLDPGWWSALTRVVETGDPVIAPLKRLVSAVDGLEHWFDFRAVRVDDGAAITWRNVDEAVASTQEQVRVEHERYRLMIENTGDVVFHSVGGILEWVSPSAREILGWPAEDLIGHPTVDFWHPDDKDTAIHLRDATYAGAIGRGTLRWRRNDGGYAWLEAVLRPVTEDNGRMGAVGVLRDASDRVAAEQALRQSQQRYRLFAETVADAFGTAGPDGTLTWVSDSVHGLLGWVPQDIVGRRLTTLVHTDQAEELASALQRVLAGQSDTFDARLATADGAWRWVCVRMRPAPDEGTGIGGLAFGWQDINDRVEARLARDRALGRDPLTALLTRERLVELQQAAVKDIHNHEQELSILCVSIDRLSAINEAFSHSAGDIVVTTVATAITEIVGDPTRVARGSGVDFLVLPQVGASIAEAEDLAERLRVGVQRPIHVNSHEIVPTVSIGIAMAPQGTHPNEAIRAATQAMHAAKDAGRDRIAFADPRLHELAAERLAIIEGARTGLRAGEFTTWLMPIASLANGRFEGYEALVRWHRPDGTFTEPKDFLPVLETTSLIGELDLEVLRQAIATLELVPDEGFVSVNVSARTLEVPGYPDRVIELIEASGIEPARLHLEITETSLLGLSPAIVDGMRRIVATGAHWYVDDFGTGYSSMSHLRDLPISGLKLDVSFTAGIGRGDERSTQLAKALGTLSIVLGLEAIAEGVETAEEARLLSEQGWRLGQGWLYGHAEPWPARESG